MDIAMVPALLFVGLVAICAFIVMARTGPDAGGAPLSKRELTYLLLGVMMAAGASFAFLALVAPGLR